MNVRRWEECTSSEKALFCYSFSISFKIISVVFLSVTVWIYAWMFIGRSIVWQCRLKCFVTKPSPVRTMGSIFVDFALFFGQVWVFSSFFDFHLDNSLFICDAYFDKSYLLVYFVIDIDFPAVINGISNLISAFLFFIMGCILYRPILLSLVSPCFFAMWRSIAFTTASCRFLYWNETSFSHLIARWSTHACFCLQFWHLFFLKNRFLSWSLHYLAVYCFIFWAHIAFS